MYDVWDRQELLFKIKLLQDRVDAFESGRKYSVMVKEHKIARESDFRVMERLSKDLAQERAEKIRIRNLWFATCEDILKECGRTIARKEKEYERDLKEKDAFIQKLQTEIQRLEEKFGAEHEKYLRQIKETYEARTQLEEEQEKNKALTAKLHKDYSNSSKSSSMSPNHKTIHNSREKSGRRPGGQPGHMHHGRKRQEPTETREIRNVRTGQRVHADFPPGITDDVNYDGTVKALAYMINNDLYTSIDKTRVFLRDVSKGKVDISTGFICSLAKQFSDCTQEEREDIFRELMTSPVLHGDFTFGRACGSQTAVIISVTDDGRVLYQGREKKGDEGVKGSPIEYYEGIFVSDHESALAKHGGKHQECMTHMDRYVKGAMENEPEKAWPGEMHDWISESVSYWKDVKDGGKEYDSCEAERLIGKFMEILKKAGEEYEYEPPSKYNREGYNTYKRMAEDPDEYVLFLRDPSVPPSNNIAERFARKFKRKAHQVMSFRSQDGVNRFCDGLSVIESVRAEGNNLFEEIAARFNHNIIEWQ